MTLSPTSRKMVENIGLEPRSPKLLVEDGRVELPTQPCKGSVFPTILIPHIRSLPRDWKNYYQSGICQLLVDCWASPLIFKLSTRLGLQL